ncbi:MAG TPA: hypothetical protein VHV08_12590, partial [Pirellulales bacterium]|nr:hypothetical protein [Pirellulales bacterium]
DMERLRLGVELAQLQRQQGEAVASGSPHAKLQWELEMLNDSLARVQEQTSIISQNRLPEF